MAQVDKSYLGDGVYAKFDGYHVTLTTENGTAHPLDTIHLEPAVAEKLIKYIQVAHNKRENKV